MILTTKQKYAIYSNEIWIYNKKPTKLKYLKHYELENIKLYLNKYPYGLQYGKLKSYWREIVDFLIKFNNNNATKEAINIIHNNRIQRANYNANLISNGIVNIMNKNKLNHKS